ncbi:MAG: ATP-binding cassette domain-containing protein, partial [Dehalococcoidia bacterium]
MLEVSQLHYRSNGHVIVDELTLSIGKQEIHAIIGANGTGKTTLAYLVMGIYSPFAGSILFEGEDITAYSISERAQKGITLAW